MSKNIKDQTSVLLFIKNILADLVYINSITATELMKITENLAALRHGEEFLKKSSCLREHDALNREILGILDKYNKAPNEITRKERLEKHVLNHLEDSK